MTTKTKDKKKQFEDALEEMNNLSNLMKNDTMNDEPF